jgi:hypothetical protein
MDLTIDGKTSTLTITRKETDSGESEAAYTFDGKKISSEQFDDLYASIQSVNAEAFADKTVSMEDAPITATFHTSRKGFETITLRLAPYDRNFYVAELNGDYGALVNKRDAEKIIKTFESIREK